MMLTGYADRTALVPFIQPQELPGPVNRTGDKLLHFETFVIHETGNENPGATAQMHHDYWSPGGAGRSGPGRTLIHFVTDANESIQLAPIDEQVPHAGDVTGNTTGVGIEICVNDRLRFPVACAKAAAIAAKVLRAEGKAPVDGATVRKHGSYPGTTHKQCPAHLNKGDWGVTWAQFLQMVNAAYGGAPPWSGPPGTYPVDLALKAYWERSGGIWLPDRYALGYALSPLINGVQRFERGRLRLKPNGTIEALLLTEVTP